MSRGRYPVRLKVAPPDPAVAKQYLRVINGGQLWRNPETFSPLTSPALFSNDAPLHIEFGCATGEFLTSMATRYPGENFVGVDITLKPMYRALELARKQELTNILFIRADANLLYPLLKPNSVFRCYILYPIPHPKGKFVLFSNRLLKHFHPALQPGGSIVIATDQKSYYQELEDIAAGCSSAYLRDDTHAQSLLSDPAIASYHHLLWQQLGRNHFYMSLRKS